MEIVRRAHSSCSAWTSSGRRLRWRWATLGSRRLTVNPSEVGWATPNITQRCSARPNGDAARPDSPQTIDLDLITAQSNENPVFYVQYANARIHSIGRKATEAGIQRAPLADIDLSLLVHERELDLLRKLDELPDVLALASADRAPHKVTTWVRELADRVQEQSGRAIRRGLKNV